MKFSDLHEAGPVEAHIAYVISEAYPRKDFGYSNYNTDPRPSVLVLGAMEHPSTGNELLYGINLNYLSRDQLGKLREEMPRIFGGNSLKSRYRRLKRFAPDIAQYYRSYDTDYIHRVHSGDLDDFVAQATRGGDEVDEPAKDKASKADMAKDIIQKAAEPVDVTNKDDDVQAGRKAWELERQLYDPDTGTENRPEKDEIADIDVEKEKEKRYQRQKDDLEDLQRRAEVELLAKQLRDTEEAGIRQPEIDDVEDLGESFYYSPSIGFVWDSPDEYVELHKPNQFIAERKQVPSLLEATHGSKILAAYDIITDSLIMDLGKDHNRMLFEANWGHTRAILFEPDGEELVIKHECCSDDDLQKAINAFQNSIAAMLMAESI